MVKTVVKKGYGAKKSWRWRRKKYFNFIAYNYHKAKLSVGTYRIEYNTNDCHFIPNNVSVITVSQLITDCPDWAAYKTLFLGHKVTGVSIECIPVPFKQVPVATNTQTGQFPAQEAVDVRSSVAIGLIAFADTATYAGIVESDMSMVLSFTESTRKYFSLLGGVVGWDTTNAPNEQNYRVAINTLALPTFGQMYWNVRFDFYILYKVNI